MKYFKKHKVELICLIIFIVLILGCLGIFLMLWFGGSGEVYGNRLEGIEKVPISEGYLNDIEKALKENASVTKVNSHIEGRLINFMITVDDDTSISSSKELSKIVKDNFTESELKFYDIQVYVLDSGTNETSTYPIIGYKHKTTEDFVWSNNS